MLKQVEVEMESKSPLLMHRYPLEPVEAIEKKSREEQAEIAAYRVPGDSGALYIPGTNIQRALVGAATYSKGKGRASLQKQAAACMLVSPEYVLLGTDKYEIDSRPVVMPATKGRVIRHRPRLDTWKIAFTLEYDDALLSRAQVREVVENMGQRVGLLDFRPACKGPMGRCVVTSWKHA